MGTRALTPAQAAERLRILRHGASIALAAAIFVLWLGSFFLESLEVCRDSLAQVGTQPVVETCGPPTASDFAVVWGAVAVLMLPEVSEVAVAGLAFKRRE